jgi:hypothetical protein
MHVSSKRSSGSKNMRCERGYSEQSIFAQATLIMQPSLSCVRSRGASLPGELLKRDHVAHLCMKEPSKKAGHHARSGFSSDRARHRAWLCELELACLCQLAEWTGCGVFFSPASSSPCRSAATHADLTLPRHPSLPIVWNTYLWWQDPAAAASTIGKSCTRSAAKIWAWWRCQSRASTSTLSHAKCHARCRFAGVVYCLY